MIQFPWPPWTLTVYMKLTQAQATAWAGWLNEVESDRFPVFTSFLEKAGGVTAWPVRESKEWMELGAWVYRWFPVAVEPYIDRKDSDSQLGFFQDQPEVRLGSAWAPWIPSDHGYSPSADALLHSVAVDLATLVTTSARASRPGLRWQAGSPIAVVTRATAAERDALQHLTGVALSDTPPGWWTRLAPLPCPTDRAPNDVLNSNQTPTCLS